MKKTTQSGPWGNPSLEEGWYPATIKAIRFFEYKNGEKALLELTFELQATPKLFITRIYLIRNVMTQAKQRLWYLCQAIDCEAYDLIEDPAFAVGRKLLLDIATVHPSRANHGQPYSDVRRFLPYEDSVTINRTCGTNASRMLYNRLTGKTRP